MILLKQLLTASAILALGAFAIAPLLAVSPERGAMFAAACYLAARGIVGMIDVARGRKL